MALEGAVAGTVVGCLTHHLCLPAGLCTCTGATHSPKKPFSRPYVSAAAQVALTSSEAHSSSPTRGLLEFQNTQQSCGRIPKEPLSAAITSCSTWKQHIGCAFLETQGYIPAGVQPFVPASLSGNFSTAETCGSSTLSLTTQQQVLRFDATKRTVLAVVSRGTGSAAYFLGRGASKVCSDQAAASHMYSCRTWQQPSHPQQQQQQQQQSHEKFAVDPSHRNVSPADNVAASCRPTPLATHTPAYVVANVLTCNKHSQKICCHTAVFAILPQGVISLQQQPSQLELCLAPAAAGSVQVQQSATYAPRLAPGSVSWQLRKTVQLPPAFTDGVVQMMEGDSVVSRQWPHVLHSALPPCGSSLSLMCYSHCMLLPRIANARSTCCT
jgi:hypothetical protein